jgi:hypothetical protein
MSAETFLYMGTINIGDKRVGTGFVADQNGVLLITANHVIEDNQRDSGITDFYFQPFNSELCFAVKEVVNAKPVDKEDIIVLELENSVPTKTLPKFITSLSAPTDVWITGHVGEGRLQLDYKPALGKVKGESKGDGVIFYELDIEGVYAGMSGSPVFVEQGIIGIVTDRGRGSKKNLVKVTPIANAFELDPRLSSPRKKYLTEFIQKRSENKHSLDIPSIAEYVEIPSFFYRDFKGKEGKTYINGWEEISGNVQKYAVIGSPGSGKTTTLKYLAASAARKALENPDYPVPVWVELHRWQLGRSGFVDFLKQEMVSESAVFFAPLMQAETVESLIEQKKITLFIDELDELKEPFPKLFSEWVEQSDLGIVVSCRENEFERNRYLNVPVVHLQALNTIQIFNIAEKYLGDRKLADEFASRVIPKGYIEKEQTAHISQVAQIPFYLALMLLDYKKTAWKTKASDSIRVTLWNLFERIVEELWEENDEVSAKLDSSPRIRQKYGNANTITNTIADLVAQHPEKQYIPLDLFDENTEDIVSNALLASTLLFLAPEANQARFPHPLFMDYFLANSITINEIDEYVDHPSYFSALAVLSTKGDIEQRKVQQALIKLLDEDAIVPEKKYELLGEIGDKETAKILFEKYTSLPATFKNEPLLKSVAKIVDRLSEDDPFRVHVLKWFETVMLSVPSSEETEKFSWSIIGGNNRYGFAEALSLIRGLDSVNLLLEALSFLSRHSKGKIMAGSYLRTQFFSGYLVRMGDIAVDKLLEVLDKTDDFEVATTISETLRIMNRPIPVDYLIRLLETHFNPEVRSDVILRLAKEDDTKIVIPHLVQALNDRGVVSSGSMFSGFVHRFVADRAALTLHHIGTPQCNEALEKNLYGDQGPSIDLLLMRFSDNRYLLDPYNAPLKTFLAEIISDFPEGVSALLPLLGKSQLVSYQGYQLNDPVANTLVKRHNYAHSERDGLGWYPKNYEELSPILQVFLGESNDLTNKKWAYITLGKIANLEILPFLENKIQHEKEAELQEAALFSLSQIIARHKGEKADMIFVQNLLKRLLGVSFRIIPQAYGGVGASFSVLVNEFWERFPSVFTDVVEKLFSLLNGENTNASLSALDILETIYENWAQGDSQDIERQYYYKKIEDIVLKSPSFSYKRAIEAEYDNRLYVHRGHSSLARDPQEIVHLFEKALLQKDSGDWQYSEKDWAGFGCGNALIYFYIGRQFAYLEKWDQALEPYQKVYSAYKECEDLYEDNASVVSNILFALSEIVKLYPSGTPFGREKRLAYCYDGINLSEKYSVDYFLFDFQRFRFFLDANHEISLEQRRDFGLEALDTLKKIREYPYDRFDEEKELVLEISRIYALIGNVPQAKKHTETIISRAQQMQDMEFLAKATMDKIAYKLRLREFDDLQDVVDDAIAMQTDLQNWAEVAQLQTTLANEIYLRDDPNQAYSLYKLALKNLEKDSAWIVPDQKAAVLHHLGSFLLENNQFEEAEGWFRQASELLRALYPNPTFPHMAEGLVAISAKYARCLHNLGKTQAATQQLQLAQQISVREGLGEHDEVALATAVLSASPGQKMPREFLNGLVQRSIEALQGDIETKSYLQEMLREIRTQRSQIGFENEIEFTNTLLAILDAKEVNLNPDSPYYDELRQITAAIRDTEKYLDQILETTLLVLQDAKEHKDEWREQVFLLGMRARMSGDHRLEAQIRGVYEYLSDTPSEKTELDQETLDVLQRLEDLRGR